MNPIITVQDLHKNFGDLEVLKGIDCVVEEYEVVCVVGPSGSGKSTFLRCLNLLESITSGSVSINGHELNDPKINLNTVRQDVGMVFQQFNVFPHMSVLDNVMLAPTKVLKLSDTRRGTRAMALLEQGRD